AGTQFSRDLLVAVMVTVAGGVLSPIEPCSAVGSPRAVSSGRRSVGRHFSPGVGRFYLIHSPFISTICADPAGLARLRAEPGHFGFRDARPQHGCPPCAAERLLGRAHGMGFIPLTCCLSGSTLGSIQRWGVAPRLSGSRRSSTRV